MRSDPTNVQPAAADSSPDANSGPHLVALSGIVEGGVYPLAEGETSVGRDVSCTICIPNRRVSRRHCVITRTGDRTEVSDLGSLNGIFVNDVPVALGDLRSGDRIRIDDTILLFSIPGDRPVVARGLLEWDEHDIVWEQAELTPPRNDVSATTLDSSREHAAAGADTDYVLRAVSELLGIYDAQRVVRRASEILMASIPADRVAIVCKDEWDDENALVCTMDRTEGLGADIVLNRSLVETVTKTGATLVHQGTDPNPAILATPAGDRGLIYLENSHPGFSFDPSSMRFASTMGRLVAVSLDNARRFENLDAERRRLAADIELTHRMIGESASMKAVYSLLARVAQTDASLLILGESGTGKELAARALHASSSRSGGPFIAINCAALMETLLESELFGHEKGAFTGAYERKRGKLEIANGGTLFLDEIAELGPSLQAKLLRALQEHEFDRVGGTKTISSDFRLVAATNTDLKARVAEGRFRDDLYFRINVISLRMPSLRERREDIALLASYFAAQTAEKCKRRLAGIAPEAKSALVQYDWPGNVRELQNAVERAVVLCSSPIVQLADLPDTVRGVKPPPLDNEIGFHEYVAEAKRKLITKAFEEAGGNSAEAARRLGLNPTYFHRLVRQLNLRPILKAISE